MYQTGVQNPDALVDEIAQVKHPQFESFGYVPSQAYRERTGEGFPDLGLRHPKEPSGGDWLRPELKDRSGSNMLNLCVVFGGMADPEFAAIEQRFPRVWQYCIEKRIITFRDPNAPPPEPSIMDVAISKVDPTLKDTDMMAYLKAVKGAVDDERRRRKIIE